MLSHNLDELHIATTDPRSAYFKQTMLELQNQELLKKSYHEVLYGIMTQILIAKDLEKELLIKDQLQSAREIEKKYLADIVVQQEEKHKAALEIINLEPKKLIDYLVAQNSTLLAERNDLQFKLMNLPLSQQKIHKQWVKQQEQAATDFAAQLKEQKITAVISADGDIIQLNEKKIDQLCTAVFSAPDPVRLCEIIPNLVVVGEAEVAQRAKVMNAHADAMGTIRLLGAIREISGDIEELTGVSKASAQQYLKILKNNPDILKAFATLADDPDKRQAKTAILADALKTNKHYLTMQIEERNRKIGLNDVRIDQCKAEIARPKPSPFSSK